MNRMTAIDHSSEMIEPAFGCDITIGVGYRADDALEVQDARRLTASFYLQRGFISEGEVDGATGTINQEADPYVDSSEYYIINGLNHEGQPGITATVRKILPNVVSGWDSFPVMEHFEEFEPKFKDQILGTGFDRCVEISALARNPEASTELDALNLYKTIWQEALRRQGTELQEDLWLMAASPALFKTFSDYFNGAIQKVGPELPYPGQVAIPAIVSPVQGFIDLVENVDKDEALTETRRFVVDFMLEGVDTGHLDGDLKNALIDKGFMDTVADDELDDTDASSSYISPSREDEGEVIPSTGGIWERKKPEVVAAVGLLGYTAIRTFAVKNGFNQPGDKVDWRVFLGIEVATTPPYVWAAGETIRSLKDSAKDSIARRVATFSVFASTLMAPYVYVGALGGEASVTRPSVVVPMGAFAAISAFGVVKKSRQEQSEN